MIIRALKLDLNNIYGDVVAADQGGWGAKGAMPPLSLLKLVIKKMAATCGTLYFMFFALPSDNPGSHAVLI